MLARIYASISTGPTYLRSVRPVACGSSKRSARPVWSAPCPHSCRAGTSQSRCTIWARLSAAWPVTLGGPLSSRSGAVARRVRALRSGPTRPFRGFFCLLAMDADWVSSRSGRPARRPAEPADSWPDRQIGVHQGLHLNAHELAGGPHGRVHLPANTPRCTCWCRRRSGSRPATLAASPVTALMP